MNATRNLVATTVVLGAFVGFSPAVRAADDAPAGEKPEQIFKTLDKNGDGKLTADEVGEDRKRFFEHLLRVADANKDGVLTADEFAKGLKDEPPVQAPPQRGGGTGRPGPGGDGRGDPAEFFKRLDANGDGKITLDEVPEPAKQFIEGMLQRAGKGKDGSISKEEYLKAAAQFRPGAGNPPGGAPRDPQFDNPEETFKRMDANGDGKVTLDEVPEQARFVVERMLEAAGQGQDGSLTLEAFKKFAERFQRGDNPQEARRPGGGGDRPRGEGQGPVRPQALFFRKLDANGDGRLSKDEISKASAVFDELDKNKDGELDPSELFGPPPEGFGGPGRPGVGGDRRPDGQRPDGDRRPESRPNDKPADTPPDTKPTAEKSGKPAVRPAEAAKKADAAKKGDAKGAARGRRMFEDMDKNGDGKISKDEAQGRLKEHFDRIDSNGDGFISTEEMQNSVRNLRKKDQ